MWTIDSEAMNILKSKLPCNKVTAINTPSAVHQNGTSMDISKVVFKSLSYKALESDATWHRWWWFISIQLQYYRCHLYPVVREVSALPFIACVFTLHVLGSSWKPQKVLSSWSLLQGVVFMNRSVMLFKLYYAIGSPEDPVKMYLLTLVALEWSLRCNIPNSQGMPMLPLCRPHCEGQGRRKPWPLNRAEAWNHQRVSDLSIDFFKWATICCDEMQR